MSSLFDTNILIYHLNDALPEHAKKAVAGLMKAGATISVITRIEVLGARKSIEQLEQARLLLSGFTEQGLTEAIVQRTISLRQAYRIKLPDAVIAATALHLSLPLVTRNTADFQAIPDLSLIDPFAAKDESA